MSTDPRFSYYVVRNFSDPQLFFNQYLTPVLTRLRTRASAGGRRKFAANVFDAPDFQKIHALVQCTADLSAQGCYDCLTAVYTSLPTCDCYAKRGNYHLLPSCIVRYEPYSFFNESVLTEAPPPLGSPPQPASLPPPPGIIINGLHLREVIMQWWRIKIRKDLRPYFRAIPSFIVWELWKRRNRRKHEGKNISVNRVIYNVTRSIYILSQVQNPQLQLRGNWPGIIEQLEEQRNRVKVTKVIWEFPPRGWVKYNTDGVYRGNSGASSYAYCLRDDKGDLLYAECDVLDCNSNTITEAKAILRASKHCKQVNYSNVIIETDSMLMLKVLKGKWEIPWAIADIVQEIKECMQNTVHIFQHTLREGNQLADYLANRAIDKGGCTLTNFTSIDILKAGRSSTVTNYRVLI